MAWRRGESFPVVIFNIHLIIFPLCHFFFKNCLLNCLLKLVFKVNMLSFSVVLDKFLAGVKAQIHGFIVFLLFDN